MAGLDGEEADFDNFTYVNENKFSEIEGASNGNEIRPQTELLNLRSSFANANAASAASFQQKADNDDKDDPGL